MAETGYFLFRSFRAALAIIAIALWDAVFTIRAVGSSPSASPFAGTHFAAYPYIMIAVEMVVVAWWIVTSKRKLERLFFCILLVILIVGSAQLLHWSRVLLFLQYLLAILTVAGTWVALLITIDIGRPLFREARIAREEKGKS